MANGARHSPRGPEKRAPLTTIEKNGLMMALIRNKDAFHLAWGRLKPDDFDPLFDARLGMLWAALCGFYEQHNDLPSQPMLIAALDRQLEENPELLDGAGVAALNELVTMAFETEPSCLPASVAEVLIRQFMEDCLAVEMREMISGGHTPMMHEMLEDFSARHAAIEAVSTKGIDQPFQTDWDAMSTVEIVPTFVSFLDKFLEGGHGKSESLGLMGTYGGGKTTLMVQISVNAALYLDREWAKTNFKGPHGISYHFSYEEPANSLRFRALCFAGNIRRDSLTDAFQHKDLNRLSTPATLKPYERLAYAQDLQRGLVVLAERKRFRDAQELLNNCWRFIDMTGNDAKNPHRGGGLVEEIAALIREDQERLRRAGENPFVGCVTTDYAGAAAERHIAEHNLPIETLRHLLRAWPLRMKYLVAAPFNCPAWSCHQLSAEFNAKGPGVLPRRTHAAECKAFAEHLDFLMELGNLAPDNFALFGCDKHRRTDQKAPIVIQMDGAFCRLLDASGTHALDNRTRKIVSINDLRRVSRPGSVPANAEWQTATGVEQAERTRQGLMRSRSAPLTP